jgi:hypothetical protein
MNYSESSSQRSGFCKLGSDLVISYNGTFLDCVPQTRSPHCGTVLTRNGQLFFRTSRQHDWELITTPSVFLFYDNNTNATFKVDICEKRIKEIQPQGRILDCTDRVIYEIKCNEWVPVYDLSNHIHRTIVLCNTVPATATTFTFEYPGCNPVVDCFSEVSAANVEFCDGTATVNLSLTDLPVGGCITLLFNVCIDHETVTIAKIFVRAADFVPTAAPRFSVIGGQTGATLGAPVTVAPGFPPLSPVLPTSGTVAITGWTEIYDRPAPGSFDPVTGTYTIHVAGDYEFTSELSYDFKNRTPSFITNAVTPTIENGVLTGLTIDNITPRTRVPYFALLRNNQIVATAPVIANRRLVTPNDFRFLLPAGVDAPITLGPDVVGTEVIDIAEIGNVKIELSLPANVNDVFRLVFVRDDLPPTIREVTGLNPAFQPLVDTTPTPFNQTPTLIPLGTTFHSEFLGPSTPSGVALPFTLNVPNPSNPLNPLSINSILGTIPTF